MSRWWIQVVLALAVSATAAADRPKLVYMRGGHLVSDPTVGAPVATSQPNAASISPYLYLNRCLGGCNIMSGADDARTNTAAVVPSGAYVLPEFTNQFGQNRTASPLGTCIKADLSTVSPTTTCAMDSDCTAAGGAGAICDTADYEWGLVVSCVKDVYSPFNLMVVADGATSGRPQGGLSYTMNVVGGVPQDVGLPDGIGGVAGFLQCHGPMDNFVSFSFEHVWNPPFTRGLADRIDEICATASQETAHAFGLDHEFSFVDGTSACNDAMSYDHCGRQYFRNKEAMCGAFGDGAQMPPRPCLCGGTQNSHAKILDVFGPGTSTVPDPTAMITFPTDGATVQTSWNTAVSAGGGRGVFAVELWLNGYKWQAKPGSAFNPPDGQQNPSTYSLVAPADVPDGAIKIVAKAFDDLGGEGDSTVTVHKGAACTADADCDAQQRGMKCNTGAATNEVASGGCYWDAPTGAYGDKCTYNQFCLSGLCQGAAGDQICTTTCVMGVADSCMPGYECDAASDGKSYCFKAAGDGGGCCSASGAGAVWAHGGLGLLVLGLVMRRRRRCAS